MRGRHRLGARVEDDGCELGVYAVQRGRQVVDGQAGGTAHEPQRRGASFQLGQRAGSRRIRTPFHDAGPDIPPGQRRTVGRRTADVRRAARQAGIAVERRVERLDLDVVVGPAAQCDDRIITVRSGAGQQRAPLRVVDGREVRCAGEPVRRGGHAPDRRPVPDAHSLPPSRQCAI